MLRSCPQQASCRYQNSSCTKILHLGTSTYPGRWVLCLCNAGATACSTAAARPGSNRSATWLCGGPVRRRCGSQACRRAAGTAPISSSRPMAHGKVPAPTNSVSSGTWRRRLASRSGYGRVRMDKLGPFRSRARIGAGSAPPARPRRDASACAACYPSRGPGYPCHAVRPGLSVPRGAIERPNRLAGAQSVWLHGRILAGVPRLAERGRHPPRRRPRRRLSRALQRRAVGPFWRACAVDRR